jgi:hypothetical protein
MLHQSLAGSLTKSSKIFLKDLRRFQHVIGNPERRMNGGNFIQMALFSDEMATNTP